MTGLPQFNFPAFDSAAAELRDQGYEIVSPAELDDPATREAALASPDGAPGSGSSNDESYGTFLSRDVKLIIDDVDGVVTLPNFEKSRGARIEVFTALTMGKPAYRYHTDEGTITEWTPWVLASALTPGDPGNGEQHHPEPSDAPYTQALDEPIVRELERLEAEGREPKSIMLAFDGNGIGNPLHPIQLFGLPVQYSKMLEPGSFTIIAGSRKATREPGHIHAELRETVAETAARGELPGGEVRITSATGGQKGSKLCSIGDLDPKALMAVGEVAGFGAKKYARLNYTKGFDWSLAFNALMRHALLFWSGEEYDEESELPHMAHAAWQCLCLLTFAEQLRGVDDRHIQFYMEGKPRELES